MNKIFETPLYPYARVADQDAKRPAHHRVIIVGAGPIGLTAAIDLAQQGVEVVVLDENDKVSWGSRAVCYSKRTLEILDRLGCGESFVDKGVVWNLGKVFFRDRKVYEFNLQPEKGHRRPAFINLQQFYFEESLVKRIRELQSQGKKIELRGKNKVVGIESHEKLIKIQVETPDGNYDLESDWLISCDGATSPIRNMLGLEFTGQVFEDNFLIADVVMDAGFPTERWFWFDPEFNKGKSALLHKQPDNVWRIDLQLGWDIDKEKEEKPENVIPRIKAMLGEEVKFELEWVSIYTFQCRRMEKFRHGRVIFAGDSAHQVSPFGARGANSGIQDVDNLCWKLKLILDGFAPESLLDSYEIERILAADENILNSTRSTDFITPKSETSQCFQHAALDLSENFEFARPLINSGRLSIPSVYDDSTLNGPDETELPIRTRVGSPCPDVKLREGFLLNLLGNKFILLSINSDIPDEVSVGGLTAYRVALNNRDDIDGLLSTRYLGNLEHAVYLIRPDQHVVARWQKFDESLVKNAMCKAVGKE